MEQFESGSFDMWDLVKLGPVSDDKFLVEDPMFLEAPMEAILSDIGITGNIDSYVHIKTDESSDHNGTTDFADTTSGHIDLPTCTSGTGLSAATTSAAASPVAIANGHAVLPTVTTGVGVNVATFKSAAPENSTKKPRNRRRRTAKQQELNRLAQQRYRERKKQKYSSLQAAVDELNIQLAKFDVLQAEKDDLEDQHAELKALVASKDQQIDAQQQTIAHQQTEIVGLSAQLIELRSKVCSDENSLSEQLTKAIHAAIKEACGETKSVQLLGDVAELLMNRINSTVRSCCLATCARIQTSFTSNGPVISVPCC